jgi:hypothetical protein
MMRKRDPSVASLDQVRITRDGDTAIIEYADPEVATTYMKYGTRLAGMTDQDVLDDFNEGLIAMEQYRAEHPYVAVEIPLGKPQINYSGNAPSGSPAGTSFAATSRTAAPMGS